MPTDPRLADLLDALADARRDLAAALERVPPALRERPPAEGAWSVAQILEHLVMVEGWSMQAFEQVAAGAPPRDGAAVVAGESDAATAPAFDASVVLDRTRRVTAPERVQPAADPRADDAWARLGRTRERTEAIVRAADGRALEQVTLKHPRFGPLTGYDFLAVLAAHERRHVAQVHEAADALAPHA